MCCVVNIIFNAVGLNICLFGLTTGETVGFIFKPLRLPFGSALLTAPRNCYCKLCLMDDLEKHKTAYRTSGQSSCPVYKVNILISRH